MSAREERILTVPNLICGLRLAGLVPLLWAAHGDHRGAFLWILVVLLGSDWLDGKLAVLLDQRTTFGARLDSAVDWGMYVCIALSFWWLEGDAVRDEAGWLLAVGLTWLLSALVSLMRFRRLPSYHTWGAKASWLAVGSAAIHLLLTGRGAAIPWALAVVTLTNLEGIAVGLILPGWRADVPTALHALRIRRERRDDEGNDGGDDEGDEAGADEGGHGRDDERSDPHRRRGGARR